MPEEQFKIKTEVTQVEDGREYKGKITVDESLVFDYNVRFDRHIENLGEDVDEILSAIHIKVKQGDREVPLIKGEEGHNFFMYMVLTRTTDFYAHPQTRGGQRLIAMNPQLAVFGASTSLGMTFKGSVKKTPQLEELMDKYRPEE